MTSCSLAFQGVDYLMAKNFLPVLHYSELLAPFNNEPALRWRSLAGTSQARPSSQQHMMLLKASGLFSMKTTFLPAGYAGNTILVRPNPHSTRPTPPAWGNVTLTWHLHVVRHWDHCSGSSSSASRQHPECWKVQCSLLYISCTWAVRN